MLIYLLIKIGILISVIIVNITKEVFMKKIIIILSFLFVNFSTYADGHSGKIHLEGFGAWSLNVMNAGNGNLSITYDGLYSGVAMKGTQFGNNSSVQCVGGLTTSKGKFNDETGICKFLFADGDTAFTKYTGSGEVGKNGLSTFEFIGGTGKYKSISGTGTVTRIQIQAAKKGYTQSKNIFKGNYKLK
jgi:hypothetical protein